MGDAGLEPATAGVPSRTPPRPSPAPEIASDSEIVGSVGSGAYPARDDLAITLESHTSRSVETPEVGRPACRRRRSLGRGFRRGCSGRGRSRRLPSTAALTADHDLPVGLERPAPAIVRRPMIGLLVTLPPVPKVASSEPSALYRASAKSPFADPPPRVLPSARMAIAVATPYIVPDRSVVTLLAGAEGAGRGCRRVVAGEREVAVAAVVRRARRRRSSRRRWTATPVALSAAAPNRPRGLAAGAEVGRGCRRRCSGPVRNRRCRRMLRPGGDDLPVRLQDERPVSAPLRRNRSSDLAVGAEGAVEGAVGVVADEGEVVLPVGSASPPRRSCRRGIGGPRVAFVDRPNRVVALPLGRRCRRGAVGVVAGEREVGGPPSLACPATRSCRPPGDRHPISAVEPGKSLGVVLAVAAELGVERCHRRVVTGKSEVVVIASGDARDRDRSCRPAGPRPRHLARVGRPGRHVVGPLDVAEKSCRACRRRCSGRRRSRSHESARDDDLAVGLDRHAEGLIADAVEVGGQLAVATERVSSVPSAL